MIGGGISGLTCASALRSWGLDVTVVDQGYRIGGRASTRRTHAGTVIADHGAPGFQVDHAAFGEQVSDWVERGVCSKWDRGADEGVDEDWFTGTPTMDAIAMDLAHGLDVRCQLRAMGIDKRSEHWLVELEDRDGNKYEHRCDHLVISTQAREVVRLLEDHSAELTAVAQQIEMASVWVLIARAVGVDALDHITTIQNSPICKVIVEDSKPGRDSSGDPSSMLVIHADPEWSAQHNDMDRDAMKELLLGHAQSLIKERTGRDDLELTDAQIHRWGSAYPLQGVPQHTHSDDQAGITLCGDALGWQSNTQNALDYGIQTAWLSGQHAAQTIVKSLS